MDHWHGKRAVITGGSSGLGRALAELLVERGARVAIVGRDQAKLDSTAAQLAAGGGEVLPIAADVTREADVARLAATVVERWAGVDLLAHCAGRSMRGDAITTPVDEFQALWEVNFLAAVRCVQALADSFATAGGHVVLVGSLASKVAPRHLGAYPTSKFPLAAFAQQLRLEMGPRGVRVLLVCPGPIARDDAGERYAAASPNAPSIAHQPGGGAKLSAIQPDWLAAKILAACERGQAELVVPNRARWLFALAQLSPRLGDWLLRKNMANDSKAADS
jgi:NAD(P)-dependent dehydrogenase (short-subunit alcohol dehydrogenase family)